MGKDGGVRECLSNFGLDLLQNFMPLLHGPMSWNQNMEGDEPAWPRLAGAKGMEFDPVLVILIQHIHDFFCSSGGNEVSISPSTD